MTNEQNWAGVYAGTITVNSGQSDCDGTATVTIPINGTTWIVKLTAVNCTHGNGGQYEYSGSIGADCLPSALTVGSSVYEVGYWAYNKKKFDATGIEYSVYVDATPDSGLFIKFIPSADIANLRFEWNQASFGPSMTMSGTLVKQ